MTPRQSIKRITTNATTNVTSATALIYQIVISVNDAGTGWSLKIQDKQSPANLIVPAFTLTVPTDGKPIVNFFEKPVQAIGGIDIVTPAGTPGVVIVWTHYSLMQ